MVKNTRKSLANPSASWGKTLVTTASKKVLTTQKAEKQRITFSFRFFKQQEPYFGLSGKQNRWFVSLLDRFQDISGKDVDFLQNPKDADGYRFHKINWKQKGIKIKRADFSWVDKQYLDNADEYEFLQFEISTGEGRVVGFFDETGNCFNVVTLDPLHNLQPSKKHNWQTQTTHILDSEIEKLHSGLARYFVRYDNLESEIYDLTRFEDYEYCAIDKDFFHSFCDLYSLGDIRRKFQEFLLEESCK